MEKSKIVQEIIEKSPKGSDKHFDRLIDLKPQYLNKLLKVINLLK